jgi:hypothetical protein
MADRGLQRSPAVTTGAKAPQVRPPTQRPPGSLPGGGPEFESPHLHHRRQVPDLPLCFPKHRLGTLGPCWVRDGLGVGLLEPVGELLELVGEQLPVAVVRTTADLKPASRRTTAGCWTTRSSRPSSGPPWVGSTPSRSASGSPDWSSRACPHADPQRPSGPLPDSRGRGDGRPDRPQPCRWGTGCRASCAGTCTS